MDFIVPAAYFTAAVLFIYGLKAMSSPVTARAGMIWAGVAMALAVLVTFVHPKVEGNYGLMIVALVSASALAWWWARIVAMTDMPQMIALYNGMGGGSAAAIAAVELLKLHSGQVSMVPTTLLVAAFGAIIGSIAFSGSLVAFAKLQGWMRKTWRFPGQQLLNLAVFTATLVVGAWIFIDGPTPALLLAFFLLALIAGILITVPIGGADMPVVISLYNALTGIAVGFKGYVLEIPALMIAGIVVGAAGTLLTQLMAKAMNRPLSNVLFSGFGKADEDGAGVAASGEMKSIDGTDAAIQMAYADKVIIVPGYGMAVAQAQHKIWELTELLTSRGVKVSFAIHPVAGRMPGHMNVLLAEAGVPYDMIFDLEDINAQFPTTDVALVIGANDVVNPAARKDTSSPIYGMPILDVDRAKNCIVIKRGQGTGFSGIENLLFFEDNTRMLYGDAQKVAQALISGVKALG
ncbi:NAD(P)(+) transhydrogenase (Re/Si-specific) subunit beta [Wenzhouxiangella sp. AB-CW3]|uniref:NAD(P)(+) transhydrogenase (Re/Si-specific) subunit beta n=1 Tax=Wenzhouxiangella sp. AB-CW3 TaxID=2771012 RepID=UPI00168B071C|nr:NAD(P)(+) transhydrogenase (Re/Si-specific) subunit beta [Wenzhouxiangella sp. AB-CW3]QOC24251.1 NAD(P)(+) transhydrogenase (Re/Si-specific) subunit beta [Wenzhouxiangella sp. AB-CW3]